MFEKEAEEYTVENVCSSCYFEKPCENKCEAFGCADSKTYVLKAFKDGAEFGYNKANEWHYPSKGEYPKCDEETQLIFYVNCYYEVGGETKIRKRIVLGFYKKSFMNDDVKLFVEKSKGYEEEHLPKDVIAWKEIVLPELPKEIE